MLRSPIVWVYDINCDDDPLDVPKSLPIAKMIDSFQIIK
jgi:hypothetical protein